LETGTNSMLNVSVYPSNATNKNVSWISSNNSIVTVGSNGELAAKAIGTATITVKSDDGGYEAKCVVTVTPATPRINIKNNPQTRTINYGDILHIKAETKNLPEGAKIQWRVSDEATGINCYIDESDNNSCYIQATGSGSCVVYAMLVDSSGNPICDSNGNEIYDSQTIKVNSGILQIIVSFIKNLFGINRTVVQTVFKGIF
ncbi:MAG: Ig-like domain-containing protein, partial [Acutalibacteraceae bacterium]